MKKFILAVVTLVASLAAVPAFGDAPGQNVLFVSDSCRFCGEVLNFLEAEGLTTQLEIIEVSSVEGQRAYLAAAEKVDYSGERVPLLVTADNFYEGAESIKNYFGREEMETGTITPTSEELKSVIQQELPVEEKNRLPRLGLFISLGAGLLLVIFGIFRYFRD